MNIKEIAKLAGVSPATVSKILNQKDDSISQETRERVLKTVKEYHYTPHVTLASSQKTWTIGCLLNTSFSFHSTMNGIIKTAQKNGYSTFIYNSESDHEQEFKNILSLCKNNVDGIIWEPIDEKSLQYASYLTEKNIPFITIGDNNLTASISLPYKQLAYTLTQNLITLGHCNIACFFNKDLQNGSFLDGYKKCLFDNQIKLDEELIFEHFNDLLLHKINLHQISSIIFFDYQKAIEFYHFLNALQYKIPENISVISLKYDFQKKFSFPEISTCTINTSAFGAFVCNRIISQIEKQSDKQEKYTQEFHLDNTSTICTPFNELSKKITVVGSINIDTYLNVTQLPHSGKTVSTSTSSIYPGGKGINQAIGASRLGQQVTLIGNVGSDLDADTIYRFLHDNNIDTIGIERCQQACTGKAYIFVENSGNSIISILSGANSIFTPDALRAKKKLFENTGYCLIQSEIPLDTVLEACKIAHEYGAKTILKPSACSQLSKKLLSYVDILIPNEEEVFDLLETSETSLESQTDAILAQGVGSIIVTLGKQGCYAKTNEWSEYFPAVSFPSIDNTGASDAFISAFASYLAMGYDIKKSIRIATYAAGFCISREGVVPALIDKNSLESYIRQHESELL